MNIAENRKLIALADAGPGEVFRWSGDLWIRVSSKEMPGETVAVRLTDGVRMGRGNVKERVRLVSGAFVEGYEEKAT